MWYRDERLPGGGPLEQVLPRDKKPVRAPPPLKHVSPTVQAWDLWMSRWILHSAAPQPSTLSSGPAPRVEGWWGGGRSPQLPARASWGRKRCPRAECPGWSLLGDQGVGTGTQNRPPSPAQAGRQAHSSWGPGPAPPGPVSTRLRQALRCALWRRQKCRQGSCPWCLESLATGRTTPELSDTHRHSWPSQPAHSGPDLCLLEARSPRKAAGPDEGAGCCGVGAVTGDSRA